MSPAGETPVVTSRPPIRRRVRVELARARSAQGVGVADRVEAPRRRTLAPWSNGCRSASPTGASRIRDRPTATARRGARPVAALRPRRHASRDRSRGRDRRAHGHGQRRRGLRVASRLGCHSDPSASSMASGPSPCDSARVIACGLVLPSCFQDAESRLTPRPESLRDALVRLVIEPPRPCRKPRILRDGPASWPGLALRRSSTCSNTRRTRQPRRAYRKT